MTRRASSSWLAFRRVAFALGCCLSLIACGPAWGPAQSEPAKAVPSAPSLPLEPASVLVSTNSEPSEKGAASAAPASARVPVSVADPQWGSALAPVTIVEFSDFQCPFCSRVIPAIKKVEDMYRDRVRVVFKHNPLPFHQQARPAAEAAATVFGLAGSRAFWTFHGLAFGNQLALTDENFVAWAVRSGVDGAKFKQAYAAKAFAAKVDQDMALAKELGAIGTPAFRINGVTVSGAQPFEKFAEVIEQQLAEAKKLRAAGTPAADIYAALSNRNQAEVPPAPPPARDAEDDQTVWKVPIVADDPVRGVKDAPVTILIFSEFQCPFCKRVEETLRRVKDEYGDQLRVVWKDNPLPFHPRARPAAELARFAFSTKGDKGFWAAHDALFDSSPRLEEEDLEIVAVKVGLNWNAAKAAMSQNRFSNRIDQSVELANDFQARGTPHFFINGVRLSGAQPFEKFKELIDEQLARAKALLATGVPRAGLYAALTREGKEPPLRRR